jgi:hypothetical protein
VSYALHFRRQLLRASLDAHTQNASSFAAAADTENVKQTHVFFVVAPYLCEETHGKPDYNVLHYTT